MKFLKLTVLTLIVALLSNCASTTEVLSEFDESVDFSQYKTFVLCLDDLYVENWEFPNYDNETIRETIKEALEKQMLREGYKTNVLKPQLQVGFQLVVKEQEAVFTNCEVGEDYNYWSNCTLQSVIYTEETLIVSVSDIEKNQVVWQASAKCDMNRSKRKLKDYVQTTVNQLFSEFPG